MAPDLEKILRSTSPNERFSILLVYEPLPGTYQASQGSQIAKVAVDLDNGRGLRLATWAKEHGRWRIANEVEVYTLGPQALERLRTFLNASS